LNIRFYLDPVKGQTRIYKNGVNENEVEEVLKRPVDDRPAQEGSRIAIGQKSSGRYLRDIYIRDPQPTSFFVITAFD